MRAHIDLAAEENLRRGMPPDEARRQARRSFGNVGVLRDSAYDVRSGDELKEYLDRERDQVNVLAQQADALVKFLQPRSSGLAQPETQALSGWRAISLELKRYAEKAPGNSVTLLEDFIRTGMDKIAPDASCQDATKDTAARSDFFLSKRSQLRSGGLERCRILSQRAYTTQIAEIFNRRLGGRCRRTPANY